MYYLRSQMIRSVYVNLCQPAAEVHSCPVILYFQVCVPQRAMSERRTCEYLVPLKDDQTVPNFCHNTCGLLTLDGSPRMICIPKKIAVNAHNKHTQFKVLRVFDPFDRICFLQQHLMHRRTCPTSHAPRCDRASTE